MATVKFQIQADKKDAAIHCRLSVGQDRVYKRRTGFSIDPEIWNHRLGRVQRKNLDLDELFPATRKRVESSKSSVKRKLDYAKATAIDDVLTSLKREIERSLDSASENGEFVNGDWLQKVIERTFNRQSEDKSIEDLSLLSVYGRHFLKNLEFKESDRGEIGVRPSTKRKYQTLGS